MNRLGVVVCFCAVMTAAGQQTAKMIYPGAKLDKAATEQAKTGPAAQPDSEVTVYTTPDAFDKVYGFFQKSGREYKAIGSRVRKLPNGKELRDAFFILDDGRDLVTSKRWVKLQRPYLGQYGLGRNGAGQDDIKDITAIVLTRKK
jgi:hypothetical protein